MFLKSSPQSPKSWPPRYSSVKWNIFLAMPMQRHIQMFLKRSVRTYLFFPLRERKNTSHQQVLLFTRIPKKPDVLIHPSRYSVHVGCLYGVYVLFQKILYINFIQRVHHCLRQAHQLLALGSNHQVTRLVSRLFSSPQVH